MNKLDMHPKYGEAYGDVLSGELKRSPFYDESQCNACPHEHRCCDMIVSCSAVEAYSIIEWVRANREDAEALLQSVTEHAKALHAFQQNYVSYADDAQRVETWVEEWFIRERKKCPFYDMEGKKCGIYPVRPANCRKAFGKGDCQDGGVRTTAERKSSMFARATRVQEAHLMLTGNGEAEMTWLISHMLDPSSVVRVSLDDQALIRMDPSALSREEMLYGLDGRKAWIENPFDKEVA